MFERQRFLIAITFKSSTYVNYVYACSHIYLYLIVCLWFMDRQVAISLLILPKFVISLGIVGYCEIICATLRLNCYHYGIDASIVTPYT